MKKIFLLILITLTFSVSIYSQNVKIRDTISVVILQNFTLPKVGAIVLSNITGVNSISGELLDANFNKIRNVEKISQKPKFNEVAQKASGGRGISVSMVFHENIDKVGVYYLKVLINCVGEGGASLVDQAYYQINVDYPSLAAPVNLRESYYFSEQEAFSFATAEYSDINAYSYNIADASGQIVSTGTGAYVKLGELFNDDKNAGKKFVITGQYNGKDIMYKDSKGQPAQAQWSVNLALPTINAFSGWAVFSDKEKVEEQKKWEVSIYNDAVRQFLFGYFGFTPTGFTFVAPKLNGLKVTSIPEGFVKNSKVIKRGSFSAVEIEVNEDFMEAMKIGDSQDMRLTITFTTQFGEKVKKEYRATIIK